MVFIFAGGIASALITAFILLSSKSSFQRYANIIFSIYLIGGSFCALLYILVSTGEILSCPHLYKTAAPVNFILPPLSFFYVRSVLKDEAKFKISDLLHFIPALVVALSYLAFYVLPSSEKIVFIQKASASPNIKIGLMGEDIQFVFRQIQAGVYIFLQWKLINQFLRLNVPAKLRAFTNSVLNWLKAITAINTLHFFSLFVVIILMSKSDRSLLENNILNFSIAVFALGYFLLASYLLLNPDVLYGLDLRYNNTISDTPSSTLAKPSQLGSLFEEEQKKLLNYFEQEKPYFKKNLSISEVSVATGIPSRSISFILNSQQGMRFTEFVNGYRIRAIIKEFESGALSNYTLAGLSDKVGFSSLSSFSRAFQRECNMSPSAYLSSLTKSHTNDSSQ